MKRILKKRIYQCFRIATDKAHLIKSFIPFLCGIILFIIVSCISSDFSQIDNGLAFWTIESGNSLNKGFLNYLNTKYNLLCIIPIVFMAYTLLVHTLFLKLYGRNNIIYQLMPVAAACLYIICGEIILQCILAGYKRPAPFQTKGYTSSNVQPECQYDYIPAFQPFMPPKDGCGYKFNSFPGEKTFLVSTGAITTLWISLYNIRLTSIVNNYETKDKKNKNQKAGSILFQIINWILLMYSYISTLIFIPSAILANVVSNQNYFTDALIGFVTSLLTSSILMWLEPSEQRVQEHLGIGQAAGSEMQVEHIV